MIRNTFVFLTAFITAALIALVVRATMFQPHDGHEGHPAAGGDYAPMVTNPMTPASPPAAAGNPHDEHGAGAARTVEPGKPVNTVCSICGMEVDPKLPTMQYQGKTIGFGCRMCPAKFKADPDRYGPAYVRNEVLKK